MRLRAPAPLQVVGRAFATQLRERHRLRPASVASAPTTLAPRAPGATRTDWHLHLPGGAPRIEAPRAALATAGARGPAGTDGAAGRGRSALTLAGTGAPPRPTVALRTLRETRLTVERGAARGRRIDPDRPMAPPAPAAPATAPAAPLALAPALRLAPMPAPRVAVTGAAASAPPPAAAAAARAALGGPLPSPGPALPAPAPVAAPPADVERLADSVIDALDRRVTAHRERLGLA